MAENIDELQAEHADLERRIAKEEERPLPDGVKLAEWKRKKLRIKDLLIEHEAAR